MKLLKMLVPVVGLALTITGCSSTSSEQSNRAVVVMSGGGAVSPFTTPTQGCKIGLSAGNTDTAIREYLLSQGKQVFTAPANDTWGQVQEPAPDSFGAFGDCPPPLPPAMTVMSTGDIEASGEKLARFINYLHDEYDITDVDFVGHSNGGLYSRAAIRILKETNAPVTVRSLTMVGTPNEGAFPTRYAAGEIGLDACMGNTFCEQFNTAWVQYAAVGDNGLNAEDTLNFTEEENGWNAAQKGALDGIPVMLLGGSYWNEPGGDPMLWPYDGIVPNFSALAQGVPSSVIPNRTCWSAPLTHSIFVSDVAALDWQTALTWNTEALQQINSAIDQAEQRLQQPTGAGCPTPIPAG